jgi:hypothetical protein
MASHFPKEFYGQHWHLENGFSQDKRCFGSWVAGHGYWSRCRKLLLRILVHNLAIILRLHSPMSNSLFSTEQACPYLKWRLAGLYAES